jgi:hypothetical protein
MVFFSPLFDHLTNRLQLDLATGFLMPLTGKICSDTLSKVYRASMRVAVLAALLLREMRNRRSTSMLLPPMMRKTRPRGNTLSRRDLRLY